MHISTLQQIVVLIYGIRLVLYRQMQDDLSLYFNKSKHTLQNLTRKLKGL